MICCCYTTVLCGYYLTILPMGNTCQGFGNVTIVIYRNFRQNSALSVSTEHVLTQRVTALLWIVSDGVNTGPLFMQLCALTPTERVTALWWIVTDGVHTGGLFMQPCAPTPTERVTALLWIVTDGVNTRPLFIQLCALTRLNVLLLCCGL